MDCFACARNDGVETSVLEPKAAAQWIPRRSLSSSSAKEDPVQGGWPRASRADLSPLGHFPFVQKRFMVPPRFAIGKCRISSDIKGLAVGFSLWRAL
jgi:hypothetical protein